MSVGDAVRCPCVATLPHIRLTYIYTPPPPAIDVGRGGEVAMGNGQAGRQGQPLTLGTLGETATSVAR